LSISTDAYEVDPRDYQELAYRMDNRIYNGSTKIITALLALTNLLVAAGVVGGVVLYGKVEALDSKVDLILSGRLRIMERWQEDQEREQRAPNR
jgi:hypothetical protein